jgi:pimeloyl-ACP methyl ester carboxylesterase
MRAEVLRRLLLAGGAVALLVLAVVSNGGRPKGRPPREAETVVLLHGLGRTRASMLLLQRRLEEAGFRVLAFSYVAASAGSVDRISHQLLQLIADQVTTPRYHLIGHSLGNVIVRNGFKAGYPTGLGRIVMLAPPNRPAKLAKQIGEVPVFRLLSGDSGRSLADDEFYARLPVPEVEFGIIAGHVGQTLTFDEPNDGVIALEATRLHGMSDWVAVPHTHTFIMNGEDTAEYCVRFLRTGRFSAAAERGAAESESSAE